MDANNRYIEDILAGRGIALLGFADLSEMDPDSRYGYPFGICIAVALKVFPSTGPKPTIEYYNEYKRVSGILRETSSFIAEKVKGRGFEAFSLAGEKQNEDFRTKLPLKTLATWAGLGWIGKSATLVTREYGNAVRLGGVLTDMPFLTGTPIDTSFCGDCSECVKRCPGGAVKGNLWNVHMDRTDLLDAFACKKAVAERGKIFDVTEGTCGICISSCPWTKKHIRNLANL